jgi:hypothetical protein
MRLLKVLAVVLVAAIAAAAPSFAQQASKTAAAGSASSASSASSATPTESGPPPAPSAASSGAPGTGAAAAAGGGTMDGSTYVVRLRDLEQRIDELKEQIRRSHTRLSLLSETILSGGVGGARAEIKFMNDMSGAFKLTRALFVLDGAVQYNKQDDSGALAEQKEIPIFSGSITPGDHTLQVLIKLRGHGYGVFSYLRGYQFEVKSDNSFTVTEGKTIELKVIAFEKGGVTTPLEQRPAVRYDQKVRTGVEGGTPGAGSSAGKAGVSTGFSIGTGGK